MTLTRNLGLTRKYPNFDRKMQEVLLVYRDFSILAEGAVYDRRPNPIYTVSIDEKPGVQAIGLTAPDLPPVSDMFLFSLIIFGFGMDIRTDARP